MKKEFLINNFAALCSKLGGNYWAARYTVDSTARKLVSRNKKFKDIHQGKKCFILGNAPSLQEVDFSLLTKEYVFTVNSAMLLDNYEALEVNYHLWMDPVTFNIVPDGVENNIPQLCEYMAKMGKDKGIECFVPFFGRDFILENHLDSVMNINYIYASKKFGGNSGPVKLDRGTFCINLTVHYAILVAVYMGFSEIYLIGVEETGLIGLLQDGVMKHAYTKEEATKVTGEKRRIEESLEGYAKAFMQYRNLMEYCTKNNIILKNCTPKSLIESIPHVDLLDVLK